MSSLVEIGSNHWHAQDAPHRPRTAFQPRDRLSIRRRPPGGARGSRPDDRPGLPGSWTSCARTASWRIPPRAASTGRAGQSPARPMGTRLIASREVAADRETSIPSATSVSASSLQDAERSRLKRRIQSEREARASKQVKPVQQERRRSIAVERTAREQPIAQNDRVLAAGNRPDRGRARTRRNPSHLKSIAENVLTFCRYEGQDPSEVRG